jgi:hypothetical protein
VKQLFDNGSDILKESFLALTYPFIFFYKPKITRHAHPHGTILLVEKWFVQNPYHRLWVNYLENKGFNTHIINFPLYQTSFENSAHQLKEYIEKNNLKNITLVGISCGGIVCLYYLEKLNGWDNIKNCIFIGSPLHGTPLARALTYWKAGRELVSNSNFFRNLHKEPIQHPEKLVCLSAKYDEMVPAWSSTLDGVKQHIIPTIGHNNFHLDCKKTYDMVASIAKE